MRYEYDIRQFSLVEKWNQKKQAEQFQVLIEQLNQRGAEGWELLGLHSFDLVGGVTGSSKGSITLTLWKRQLA